MIRSMTGYGRKETGGEIGRFTIEIRSVNNRYIDIQVKMPKNLAVMEPRVRKALMERFSRGRFEVFITRNGDDGKPTRFTPDYGLADQYVTILRELKTRFDLPGEVDLALLAGLQDIITKEEVKENVEALWPVLSDGLSQAMDELNAMRAEEGVALGRDIFSRLETIDALISSVHCRAPLSVENARKRMTEALGRLLGDLPEPGRVAQEIAILAERTDVTEELTRLGSHMVRFRALLAEYKGEAVGRKLDFLLQEMGREANTIASKAMDAETSQDVVTIKAELEKIREQAQNIE